MTKLDEALGLFPSVIKCGEQWSSTCQAVLEAAKAELAALRATAAPEEEGQTGDYDFDNLTDLVTRFSAALLGKLKVAEAKYGHNSGWMRDDWRAACQRSLNEHLAKGDPRDVAAYCAFLWHHGWPTIGPLTPEDVNRVAALPSDSGKAAPVAWQRGSLDDLIWDLIHADRATQAANGANYCSENTTRIAAWHALEDAIEKIAAPAPATEDRLDMRTVSVEYVAAREQSRVTFWTTRETGDAINEAGIQARRAPSPSVGTPAQPSARREDAAE